MFDIGFFELMVVAIIGLLVIGPERLPETIRTLSLWAGRIKRSLRDTRAELEQHIGTDDIRRQLHNEEVLRSLKAVRNEVNRTLNERVTLDTDSDDHRANHSSDHTEPLEHQPVTHHKDNADMAVESDAKPQENKP